MRKAVLLTISATLAAAASGATLDAIAAKVDDAVITVGDVMQEIRRGQQNPADSEFSVLYSNAVDRLVNRRLVLRAAAAKNMEMQEWLVDNRIREIVNDAFDGDMNKLNASLAESRIPITEWRNTIRDDMIVSAMRFQMVEKHATASPSAMQEEFRIHRDRYAAIAKTTVSVILLRPAGDDDKGVPSVTTRGDEILARLDKGEDFAELARKYSSDSHAKDGGVWKDVDPVEAFRPEIAEAISKLKVGEFSPLVNLDGWGFIVRKDAETKARDLTFAEAYSEVEKNVRHAESERLYAEWIARLRGDAYVKINPMPDAK